MTFKREKMEIGGAVVVLYTEEKEGELNPFTIEASRQGVVLRGSSLLLEDDYDLRELAKVVSDAWADHKSLIPKLILNH